MIDGAFMTCLRQYVSDNYRPETAFREPPCAYNASSAFSVSPESFSDRVMALASQCYDKDSDFYNAAGISRQVYSKMIGDSRYRPSRGTAYACCIALHLNIDSAKELLALAGMAFSPHSMTDVIIEFFIREKHYDIDDINEVLYSYNQPVIGCA